MNFVTTLLNTVDAEMSHYVFDTYHAVGASLSLTLSILLLIYFAGLGWMVIRGYIRLTPSAIAWHIFKACIIYILAIRWDYFSYYIVDVFTSMPDHLLGALLAHTTNSAPVNITQALAEVWEKGNNIFVNVWQESGTTFWLGTLFGFLGYAAIMGLVAVPLFYITMSKIALGVLLVLAPLFLPLYLWESTRAIFNGWIRLLVKWALTPLFIFTFMSLYLTILQTQIDVMANVKTMPTTASISVLILLSIVMIATFFQAGKIATEIARGINLRDLRTPQFEVTGKVMKAFRER